MANRERVGLLVTALRSGDYEQGRGMLHNIPANTWCCLGVACDVARRNGLDLKSENAHGSERFEGNGSDLPWMVRDWYEFSDSNPLLSLRDGLCATAVSLNDATDRFGEESEFEGIADAFERTYLAPEKAEATA